MSHPVSSSILVLTCRIFESHVCVAMIRVTLRRTRRTLREDGVGSRSHDTRERQRCECIAACASPDCFALHQQPKSVGANPLQVSSRVRLNAHGPRSAWTAAVQQRSALHVNRIPPPWWDLLASAIAELVRVVLCWTPPGSQRPALHAGTLTSESMVMCAGHFRKRYCARIRYSGTMHTV